ncbi:sugar transferase [uncultured Croceitalea sp.]|uniref:sugar transferase n=1 Tax=uncultured Croceitalea sp. TaxID=1798908 RepID=UPI0033066D40
MYPILKSISDYILASLLFAIFLPLLLLLTIILAFHCGSNPFFMQNRGGKDGNLFKIIKFKTMNEKRDENGNLLSDVERTTKLGQILRNLSLDEIPQLFNILMGHMSFVGPRPFTAEYLTLYDDYQNQRHQVKPGITGWAQVKGRNTLSWQQKFELDIWYVQNRGFFLDIKILFLTAIKLFKFSEVNNSKEVTAVAFNGNN